MAESSRCSECDTPIPGDAPLGLCPRCLIRVAREEDAPGVAPVLEGEGDQIGPYKLLQKIGEGGFGVVFMAEQSQPVKRRVALKIIKAGMDTRQVIGRFEAERQALAMMEHPNIARVLDAGATETGRPYFAMELVRGVPITTFCDEHAFDNRQRLELFQDVCAAVGHAHQKGIIHRDLKPSNILVGMDGDTPVVKVIDFGVAKATQLQLTDKTVFTRFEQFIGTPLYISPEQASLSPVDIDTRSDIYSLGVLLYELLTGKPPLDQETLKQAGFDEMRRLIREHEAPKPSTRLSTATDEELRTIAKARHTEPRKLGVFVRGDLDWIVLKALEKDRRRRYETTNALRRDIARFLNDEVVTATPPSAAYKFRKFARRNKGVLTAVSAVALSLIVGSIVSTSQWLRAETEADAARKAHDAEQSQRALAEQRLRESALSDRVTAGDLTTRGRELDAMVYLARSCRNDPAATEAFESSIALLRGWKHPRAVAGLQQPLGGSWLLEEEKIAWSPDGALVAICGPIPGSDDTRWIGRIWDSRTGEVVLSFDPETEDETVEAVEFDPAGNCLMLVWSASSDGAGAGAGRVRIRDAGAQRYRATLEGSTLTGSGKAFRPAAFSSDASMVLFAEEPVDGVDGEEGEPRKRVGVWSTSDGRQIASLEHATEVQRARFSRDGTRVLCYKDDAKTFVWDIATSRQVAATEGNELSADGSMAVVDGAIRDLEQDRELLLLDSMSVPCLSDTGTVNTGVVGYSGQRLMSLGVAGTFSPDGLRFASFRRANVRGYHIWSTETGKLLKTIPTTEGDDSRSLVSTGFQPQYQHRFSRDGLLLATFDEGRTKIWDTRSGDLLGTLPVEGAIFSPDGRRILTSDFRVWEWSTRGLDHPLLEGRHLLTSHGKMIRLSGRTVRVFSFPQGAALARWDSSSNIGRVAVSADGSLLATSSDGGKTLGVWNVETGAIVHEWRIEGNATGAVDFTFSPDGKLLAATAFTGTREHPDGRQYYQCSIFLYSLQTGDLRAGLPALERPEFSPDGKRFAIHAEPRKIDIYATDGVERLKEFQLREDQSCRSLGFRPNGSGPVILTHEGELLDAESGRTIVSGNRGSGAYGFEFSPDGRTLGMFSSGDVVRTYDSATGRELGEVPLRKWWPPAGQDWYIEGNQPNMLRLRLEPGPEVPSWWGDFLELVCQRHFNDRGELSSLPFAEAQAMRRNLFAMLALDDSLAAEVARWWLAPSSHQGVHLGSAMLAADLADQLIQVEASDEDLERAYRLDPGHPLIHLALATRVGSARWAEFLARYSLERLPDDPALKWRAEALQADLRISLALLAARHGDWDEAWQQWENLKLEELPGRPERSGSYFRYVTGALLAWAAVDDPGRREAYDEHCREFLQYASEPENPAAYRAVTISLALPPRPDSGLLDSCRAMAWMMHSKPREALVEYRSGNHAKAIELLGNSSTAMDSAVYAMAAMRSGDSEVAREKLAEAEQELDQALNPESGDLGTDWALLLASRLVVDEARELIGSD